MDPTIARLLVVVAGVALTALVGRAVQGRRDRVRRVASAADSATGALLATADAGTGAGPSAILFGSTTCAPCETVRSLLTEVADARDDFTWRYVDAADHLDLARAHNVRSVPTLLVLDGDGAVVARTSGVPDRRDLATAVAEAAWENDHDAATGDDAASSRELRRSA